VPEARPSPDAADAELTEFERVIVRVLAAAVVRKIRADVSPRQNEAPEPRVTAAGARQSRMGGATTHEQDTTSEATVSIPGERM
jgi:hypothetical protein